MVTLGPRPQPVTRRGMLDQTVCQNFSAFTVPISGHHRFYFTFCTFSLFVLFRMIAHYENTYSMPYTSHMHNSPDTGDEYGRFRQV